MKTCSKCCTAKLSSDFFANPQHSDGLQTHCKECQRTTKREWARKNPEKVQAYKKQWNIDNAEHTHEYNLAYYWSDPETARARRRQWVEEHREQSRAYARTNIKLWRKKNPTKKRALDLRRRAQINGSPHTETVDKAIIYKRDKEICSLCHTKVAWEDVSLDHIIPLALGGTHTYKNIALAHWLCNVRKNVKAITQQMRLF